MIGAFVLTISVALTPVFSNQYISVNDVYNHVARAVVLGHYTDTPLFRQYWMPHWQFVPYATYDLASMGILSWFSTEFTVKLIVAATFIVMISGALLLARVVHGRWSATALLSALFLINRNLLSGFVNYLFGIGMALIGLAAWIALRRAGIWRLVVLAVIATTICTVHPLSCIVLGVSVAGVELAELFGTRARFHRYITALIVPGLAFLPALFLLLFCAPHPQYQTEIIYRGLGKHLSAFAVSLTYDPVAEALGLLAIGAACVACWVSGRLRVDRRLIGAAVLLAMVQLAMPEKIGVSTALDHRIPIAFWIILVCALDVRIERARLAAGFVVLVAAVFALQIGLAQARWRQDNVFYGHAQQILSSLPPQSRIGMAFPNSGPETPTNRAIALYWLPVLEIVPKGGYVQTLFTLPDQDPLLMRSPFEELSEKTTPGTLWDSFVETKGKTVVPSTEMVKRVQGYDYLVFLNPEPFRLRSTDLLAPVASAPGIQVYRVEHGVS